MKVVYIGIFVPKAKLAEMVPPAFEKVQCDHVTVANPPPTPEEIEFFRPMIGKEIEISIKEMVWDDKCQAVRVEVPVQCRNPIPHITISHRADTKPVYSNELLANKSANKVPMETKITGVIDFFPRTLI